MNNKKGGKGSKKALQGYMSERNSKPLVSVILSCYNYGEYVGQTIDSILNQTYDNIELVVLDNGSTDNTYDILQSYGDKIHKLLHLEKNDLNISGDLIRSNVAGEYVACMTADDYWHPEKIERQMQVLSENPEVYACFTWIHTVDEQGNIVLNSSHNAFEHKNRTSYEWMKKLVLQGNCFAYPSAVVEKNCFYELLKKHLYQMGDKYLWMNILLDHDVHVIEEPLTYVRWHPHAKVANMSAMNLDSTARTINEEVMTTLDIIERMNASSFTGAFGEFMRNAQVTGHEQILCEKLFFLMRLAEEKRCFEQAVIVFYYKYDIRIDGEGFVLANALKKYYDYSYLDFQKYCANHGMGLWQLQLNYVNELKKELELQKKCIVALQEVMKLSVGIEERKRFYRRKVTQQLDGSVNELVAMIYRYIGEILTFISDSNDEVLENGLSEIIANVCGLVAVFERLWKTFLCHDIDIEEIEWHQQMTVLKEGNVDVEVFCNVVLPFITKVYVVLEQYSGI